MVYFWSRVLLVIWFIIFEIYFSQVPCWIGKTWQLCISKNFHIIFHVVPILMLSIYLLLLYKVQSRSKGIFIINNKSIIPVFGISSLEASLNYLFIRVFRIVIVPRSVTFYLRCYRPICQYQNVRNVIILRK